MILLGNIFPVGTVFSNTEMFVAWSVSLKNLKPFNTKLVHIEQKQYPPDELIVTSEA